MAEVRPLKRGLNKLSDTDPTTDSITFVNITGNVIAGDLDLKSKDGKKWWRFIEQRKHIDVINMNTGDLFVLPLIRSKKKHAKCARCGVRAKRTKARCSACGKKAK